MYKYFLIIFFQIALINGFSQTFEKYYHSPQDDFVGSAIQIDNNQAIYPVNSGSFSSGIYNSKLKKINIYTGESVKKVDVEFDFAGYNPGAIFNIIRTDDDEVTIIGSCMNYTSGDKQIYIARYSLNLEYIMDTIVGDIEKDEVIYDVIYSSDSLLVFAGRYELNSLLLEERDVDGTLIRDISYANGGMLASTVTEIPYENKYHLYRFWDSYHSFNVIEKSDLSVSSVLEYPERLHPRNAVRSNDSSYYYVAGHRRFGDTSNLYYAKISSTGEILQDKEYETDSIAFYTHRCFSINDSKIYFSGAYPCTWIAPIEFYPEQRWILMYQLDHNGEICWQKFYKGDVNFMPEKVLATTDGGALVFSSFYDWNDPDPYQRDVHILKIDSLGYYTPLVGTEEEMLQMERQILVYPNPVETTVNFAFGLYQNLEISIYDMTGKVILCNTYQSTTTIDLSSLKPGIYPYQIKNSKGFFEEGKIVKK